MVRRHRYRQPQGTRLATRTHSSARKLLPGPPMTTSQRLPTRHPSNDLTTSPDSPPVKQFEALRVTLGHLLKLVSIRLEDGDNPQVIFETLNGRGTPLIALDLLKNAVFLKAERENA